MPYSVQEFIIPRPQCHDSLLNWASSLHNGPFSGECTHSFFFSKTWISLCSCDVLTAIYGTLRNTQKSFLTPYIICLCLFACFLALFLFLISKVIHVYDRKYWKTDYQKEENKITHTGTTQIEVNHFEYFGIIFPLKSNLSIDINLVLRTCLIRRHFDLITQLLFVLKIAWWFQYSWPLPPPGDLPNPGVESVSPVPPAFWADSLPTVPLGKPLRLNVLKKYKEKLVQ